ncbi:MAG: copper-binding protein [Gallionellaceae bacterium]
MKRIAILSLILSLSPFAVPAQSAGMNMNGMDMKAMNMKPHDAAIDAVGVVKQVDQTRGIAVIAHEPIKSLGWSAMTMNFRIEDKALFDKLKQGKRVKFEFIIRGEDYVVTKVK